MSFAEMICEKAVDKWGKKAQVIVAIEELAELQKELTKYLRGDLRRGKMLEEMADVEIMLTQLKVIFGNNDEEKQYKVDRLKYRIESMVERQDGGCL